MLKRPKYILSALAIVIALSASSQKKREAIFPADDPYFKKWGWMAGLGANYSFPISKEYSLTYVNGPENTISVANYKPVGRLGAMLEGGAFYLVDNYILSYIDGGVRVNWFRGKEDISIVVTDSMGVNSEPLNEFRSFDYANASLRLNANNIIQVSNYGFIQNTLGVNLDYYFLENTNNPATIPLTDYGFDPFQIQLHYKLAYGFRLDIMHYVIIGLDAAILGVYPWNDGRQTLDIFGSNYWPVTLSVKVLFMNKSNRPDCKKPIPLDMNKKRKEAKMF